MDFKKSMALLRQALKGEDYDYTSGSIRKAVVLLAIPMMLECAWKVCLRWWTFIL